MFRLSHLKRILGKELHNKLASETQNTNLKYIIQENISSGGEGTFIISNVKDMPLLYLSHRSDTLPVPKNHATNI